MSQLEFDLDPATEQAITELAPHLAAVAIERIAIEFEKLLLGPGKQSRHFVSCYALGLNSIYLGWTRRS
ncbi:hypothetical protein OVA29_08415 [Exiguobacterium sp. SL14]|nr:hypothetical protein [Exiguobacterium sp. SL14]MCY1690684.1 hypothetical protein [Exiguobacterium sp. SL14]